MSGLPAKTEDETGKRAPARASRLLYWAAGLSIGALVAHAIDAPDHLREWWGYSTFFVVAGSFQFFYGFGLLLRPWRYDDAGELHPDADRRGRGYYMLGIVLTAAIIIVYIISRGTGLPFLGADAAREPVTVLSLVPVAEGVPLLYCLARLWRGAGAARASGAENETARHI